MIASPFGGVNIEEIAKTNPSAILKEPVNITEGMYMFTFMYRYKQVYTNDTVYVHVHDKLRLSEPIYTTQHKQNELCSGGI